MKVALKNDSDIILYPPVLKLCISSVLLNSTRQYDYSTKFRSCDSADEECQRDKEG